VLGSFEFVLPIVCCTGIYLTLQLHEPKTTLRTFVPEHALQYRKLRSPLECYGLQRFGRRSWRRRAVAEETRGFAVLRSTAVHVVHSSSFV
jgi:hypothetical protein